MFQVGKSSELAMIWQLDTVEHSHLLFALGCDNISRAMPRASRATHVIEFDCLCYTAIGRSLEVFASPVVCSLVALLFCL